MLSLTSWQRRGGPTAEDRSRCTNPYGSTARKGNVHIPDDFMSTGTRVQDEHCVLGEPARSCSLSLGSVHPHPKGTVAIPSVGHLCPCTLVSAWLRDEGQRKTQSGFDEEYLQLVTQPRAAFLTDLRPH